MSTTRQGIRYILALNYIIDTELNDSELYKNDDKKDIMLGIAGSLDLGIPLKMVGHVLENLDTCKQDIVPNGDFDKELAKEIADISRERSRHLNFVCSNLGHKDYSTTEKLVAGVIEVSKMLGSLLLILTLIVAFISFVVFFVNHYYKSTLYYIVYDLFMGWLGNVIIIGFIIIVTINLSIKGYKKVLEIGEQKLRNK